jgi:nucleoside-diphosphate-sugar epimerase
MFRPGAPDGNFTFVDVRDVARAHLLTAEPGVTGQFAVLDVQPSFRQLVQGCSGSIPGCVGRW